MPDDPAVDAGIDDTEGLEVDGTVDEANDVDKDIDMDGEEEGEDGSQRDEEEQANGDEEPAEVDDEPVDPDAEIDGEEDQEQDPEVAEVENEQENEHEHENDLDEGENDEDPPPDGDLEDQEIELQPAHRAEALDVLASIELKFALLRERVYVEKMETLAWEEAMIQACMLSFAFLLLLMLTPWFSAVHPEMQYLQQEMIKRRDKRLELASRKRSYEVANATKRRRADEDGVWSWWKVPFRTLSSNSILISLSPACSG